MSQTVYRLLIALAGLVGLAILLVAAVLLARAGQPIATALTGTGAGGLAVREFFRLLTLLGSR